MLLTSAPVYRVPGAAAAVEDLGNTMRLILMFPQHADVSAWRAMIAEARQGMPEIHALALAQVLPEWEEWDAMVRGEKVCPRCGSTGEYSKASHHLTKASTLIRCFCECPAGERAAGRSPLTSVEVLNPQALAAEEQLPLFI